MEKIEIKLPKGFMNTGVVYRDKHPRFVADTNDSANWDTLDFPLPEGKWEVYSEDIQNNKVILINK